MLQGHPARRTQITAFVRGVSIARTESGSIFWLTRSTSAKTGVAPAATTQLADAKKLRAGTITSSTGPTPSARSANSRANVPLASDRKGVGQGKGGSVRGEFRERRILK